MVFDRDLTFLPYLTAGAFWNGVPVGTDSGQRAVTSWQWSPAVWRPVEGTLDHIDQLTAAGWERVGRWPPEDNDVTVVQLWGQLADIRLMQMPGQSDQEVWARSADIARVRSQPVTLAFAVPEELRAAASVPTPNTEMLHIAQVLPPPQFGELGIVSVRHGGQLTGGAYELSDLGEDGLELWRRMGAALKTLAAPAEWWQQTPRLEACMRGEYAQLREALRSKLLATKGQERELWRTRLAQLDLDRQHAQALHVARERARKDPTAWLERWQEVRDMAAELATLYWQADQHARSVPAVVAVDTASEDDTVVQPEPIAVDAEGATILAQLLETSSATGMDTTSYQEDRAVREASLARPEDWKAESDVMRFKASNNLAVYFLDRDHPLSLAEAQAQLLRVTPRTVLTIRIALGLWNLRRHTPKYTRNNLVGITYNEILEWRGVPKHSRPAYPGSSQRVSDGWRTEDREDVRRDFAIAARYYLRGKHTIGHNGRYRELNVDAPYLHTEFVSWNTLWSREDPLGVFIAPGGWIGDYEDVANHYLAEIDRRVFELNPHHEQHELKIALYLTELWREQANSGQYAEPIVMADLLQRSVITVDRKHMERFAPRIEQALENLRQRGIIGSYECLTPVSRDKARWTKDWLAARWRILPPDDLMHSYIEKGITKHARQLPPGRKKR